MSLKILNTIGDVYTPQAKQILSQLGEVEYVQWNQEQLLQNIASYDIAVVGLGLHFDQAVLSEATHLRMIATSTTGLDHIDMAFADQKGLTVLSLKNEKEFLDTITSTAELALGLMIDVARGISASFASVQQYEWRRENFRGHSLQGKVLGIVGLGRLGTMMSKYAQGLGMQVIAYDPLIEKNVFTQTGVTSVSFEQLLSLSDVISLHVHLNAQTENMFSAETLQKMKPSAYLINTARGKIVNESAVLEALEKNTLAGYATDVLDGELAFGETFLSHPLVLYAKTHSNIVITPHIGGMTHESREATDIFVAHQVQQWVSMQSK